MLKVENLTSGYGSVKILWDVSFTIADGEIVAFLGSNGAGKTTTVRTVTGMIRATGAPSNIMEKNSRRRHPVMFLKRVSSRCRRAGSFLPV